MAITGGFKDGTTGYSAAQFASFYDLLFESGIAYDSSGTLGFKVTNSGTTLSVAAGLALGRGYWLKSDSAVSLTITAPSSGSRIDRVVVKCDLTVSGTAFSVYLKAGTSGSSPAAPDLTRSSSYYELSVAQVKITSAGEVTLTDERANESVCGVIRPKNDTGIDELLSSMETQFETLYNSLSSQTGVRSIYIQSTEPTSAATGSIWI